MNYLLIALVALIFGLLVEYVVGPIKLLISLISEQGSKVSELGDKLDEAGDDIAEKVKDLGEEISNLDNKE